MIELLIAGKWFMVPLMMCSILMIAVILERRRSLEMAQIDLEPFRQNIIGLLRCGKVGEARETCARTPGPVAEILGVGLRRYEMLRNENRKPEEVEDGVIKAMEDHAPHVVAGLERYLVILATVGNIAPLFGFAGTVTGMISVFTEIEMRGGADVKYISKGIHEALITTAAGLLIAIPAMLAFNYFTTRVHKYVLEIEESSTRLIEAVTFGGAADVPPPSGGEKA